MRLVILSSREPPGFRPTHFTATPNQQIDSILTSPARRCASTAELIAGLQGVPRYGVAGGGRSGAGRVLMTPELRNLDVGLWEGQPGAMVSGLQGFKGVSGMMGLLLYKHICTGTTLQNTAQPL